MENTTAMRVTFFVKMFKFESRFEKSKEILGICFFPEIIASEDVAINSLLRREYLSSAINV